MPLAPLLALTAAPVSVGLCARPTGLTTGRWASFGGSAYMSMSLMGMLLPRNSPMPAWQAGGVSGSAARLGTGSAQQAL